MSESLAPIVLFVYNRPLHTKRTLEALSINLLADQSKLFVFADGPKVDASRDERNKIKAVQEIVLSKKWCGKINLINRDTNLGLADNIVAGVTQIVKEKGKVIVLEDDLIISPGFLKFMNDALTLYERDDKVMHISGYMFPVKGKLPPTFFYRQTSCWGWATWERAWNFYEPNPTVLLSRLKKSDKIRHADIDGTNQFINQLEANANQTIRTWAVKWHFSVELQDGLCLHPGSSLVHNIGLDGTGINAGTSNRYQVVPADEVLVERIKIADYNKVYPLLKEFYRPQVITKRWVLKVVQLLPKSFQSFILRTFSKAHKEKIRISDLQIKEDNRLKLFPRFTETTTEFLGKKLVIADAASFQYSSNEIFNEEIYKFNSDKTNPFIIDSGANVGLSVLYFKKIYPDAEIVAFEPDQNIFRILNENLRAFHLENVTTVNKGLWNEETTLRFYAEGADGGRIAKSVDKENIVKIETISLRPFLNRPVDFLKIDIEGAELNVLQDCKDLLVNVKMLFVEYHSYLHEEQRLDELLSILRESGFRYSIQQHGVVSMNPFISIESQSGMDILLNISAFRTNTHEAKI